MDRPPNAPPRYKHILSQILGIFIFTVLSLPLAVLQVLRYCVPSCRVHPTWSLSRHLVVALGRSAFAWTSRWTLPRPQGPAAYEKKEIVHKLIGKGTEVDAVTVAGVPDALRVGDLAVATGTVGSTEVPAFWTYQSGKWPRGDELAANGEKVILYVPGGTWVLGHPMLTPFPYYLSRAGHRRVLSINHRKALSPSTAAPAQFLDLLAGYIYLIQLRFRPENITLVGDSSGGHLLLGLTRYLAELAAVDGAALTGSPSRNIALPGAVMLLSPSGDLSHAPYSSIPTDWLSPYLNRMAYPSLSRHYPPDALRTNPYFSPAICGSFRYLAQPQRARHIDDRRDGQNSPGVSTDSVAGHHSPAVRVWIQYGDVELLAPDIRRLIERMREDGVPLEVDEVPGGCHLDSGIAFALRERGQESSWTRLLEAVERY
ncbi:alpha/beta-hydrolase [Punctularia strigosozonata HHB-11173 SS5]|uniref:alpha/beta-hydrolase n=1 Tax=Punctularia strigosozonata (strain HHB-11173) TaxID=741275 RepID=UPI0004416749|nr:alpha/beta-hydrolase [Punctularia strigosozonata HHB-11173 SS5]EIN14090.1 alpha/beta-hydrolase [Punctularia strigosozonata HHB-11173 SS5]